jgi:hypothetical protein
MPARRGGYWVILAGTTPTAFRARERDDLVPTLRQLQRTQPDVTLQWFARGKLWESPDAAEAAAIAERRVARARPPTWRPGGAHKDPRERYQMTRDQKRARFKRNLGGPAKRRVVSPKGPPKRSS